MGVSVDPEGFKVLRERVGLAMMLGQKVQFSLAGYFAATMRLKTGCSVEIAKETLAYYLSKPMGIVVSDIAKQYPLPEGLAAFVLEFKSCRNWLVHDFDEEATPYLAQGQRIEYYTAEMERAAFFAQAVIIALDNEGKRPFGR